MGASKYLVQILPVGVGDEYLPEGIIRDNLHYVLHSLGVELVEDVIEEQQWSGLAACALEKVELGQLESQHEGLVLSLRPFSLYGVTAERHIQVVLVYSVERIAKDMVFAPSSLDEGEQVAPVAVAGVDEAHLFLTARYLGIEMLEDRHELLHELSPLLVDALACLRHYLLKDGYDFLYGHFFCLQHGIALLHGFVVVRQVVHVLWVVLRYDSVHESSPVLAAARDDGVVGRRRYDDGQQANVFRQPFVLLLVALHMLLLVELHAYRYLFLCSVKVIESLHHHHDLSVAHVHGVQGGCCALRHGEEIDGVKNIGLALAVVSYEAVYLRGKTKFRCGDIAVVEYGKSF